MMRDSSNLYVVMVKPAKVRGFDQLIDSVWENCNDALDQARTIAPELLPAVVEIERDEKNPVLGVVRFKRNFTPPA